MNLAKLFEAQKKLDERIYERFPGLKEEDWSWKITALLVELGECANEHRGFKRWSDDREQRTTLFRWEDSFGEEYESQTDPRQVVENFPGNNLSAVNPLLEEFVDCLHFFISIALELKMFPNDLQVYENYTEETVEATFNKLFSEVASIDALRGTDIPGSVTLEDLQETLYLAFSCFIGIGEQFFDFTWDQIEQAYYTKNEINHARQKNKY